MQPISLIIQTLDEDFSVKREQVRCNSLSEPAAVKMEGPYVEGNKNLWRIRVVDEFDITIKLYTTFNYLKAIELKEVIAKDRHLDSLHI